MKKYGIDFTFLYKKYPGQWVALANNEKTVLASGKNGKMVLKKGRKKVRYEPILYKVPSKISLTILLSVSR